MLSKIATFSSFAAACFAKESMNAKELSQITMSEFNQLYNANAMKRQSPININTHNLGVPTVNEDKAFTAKFASKVSF